MMWWNHGGWGAGDWLAMSFMMLIFWSAVIALFVWLVRSVRDRSEPAARQQRQAAVHEMLAGRLASGEIDEAEFNRSRALLRRSKARL